MMSHIDCWSTLAAMAGLTPPQRGPWTGDDGKPSAYILGTARHSARRSWVYVDGESGMGARVDVAGDPDPGAEDWVSDHPRRRPATA
jgi:hypothetical protein